MRPREIIEADWTFTGERLERDVRIAVDDLGRIAAVGQLELRPTQRLEGRALLPGFVNAHSHAFQRGLRGRGERFPEGSGSFWTWREAMYGLVQEMTPERMHRLSLLAFREMLAAGMTSVGEFHYLHHVDPAALDHGLDAVVLDAAKEAGIRIVLLSAYYRTGGFDERGQRLPLEPAQRRFATPNPGAYWTALDRLADRLDRKTQSLGVVVHSIRAAEPSDFALLLAEARERGLVLHVHLEEQRREVSECLRAYGKTPMALLLDELGGGEGGLENVCAVHCTHTAPEDMQRFLDRGGRVCLTPTTEASLGDGTPDVSLLASRAGALSLGSDSNTRLSMFEEMRWLEYAQRLSREERGILRRGSDGVVARTLLEAATSGGANALGLPAGRLAPGLFADMIALDLTSPVLREVEPEHLPDGLALACDDRVVRDVFVGGRKIRDFGDPLRGSAQD